MVITSSRSVNKNLQSCKFKYECLPALSEMSEKEFWFITFDLKSGYHQTDILATFGLFPLTLKIQSQKQQAVPLAPRVATIYVVFKALPFGLSLACYLFTKMLRPFEGRWRSQGVVSIMYIDDGIAGCNSKQQTSEAIAIQSNLIYACVHTCLHAYMHTCIHTYIHNTLFIHGKINQYTTIKF